jgi:hypothetical protein
VDCKGNTGVGNSAETQETIYNDKIEEIGIKNKMIANKKILNKEWWLKFPSSYDILQFYTILSAFYIYVGFIMAFF